MEILFTRIISLQVIPEGRHGQTSESVRPRGIEWAFVVSVKCNVFLQEAEDV